MIASLDRFLLARRAATFCVGWALVLLPARAAENVSPLAKTPDWSAFEKYQETITHDEFVRLLQNVYCTRGVSETLINVEAGSVKIATGLEDPKWFTLRFAADEGAAKPAPHTWRSAKKLGRTSRFRELKGLHIALDPGHLGGSWARMEERWFQVGDSKPIQEGDMTLLVAKILAPKLRALGAKVSFVRDKAEPATAKRPKDLEEVSKKILLRAGEAQPREDYTGPDDPEKEHTVRWHNELLFYRNSEIRQRAELVNETLKPDLVLCLHFNAESWDEPTKPTLIDRNHLHLLVNGSYLPPELEFDDVRFEMLERLLSRTHAEEIGLADTLAKAMARRTRLPPYKYTTENVTKAGTSGYVYLRNLLATRLYHAPVIYFEPYVMNSDEVFWRVQEGDYDGIRNVNGTNRPSIYREYAAGVVDGLIEYYRAMRN
ncbi:MAG: hypothetical protein ABIR71_00860 [Chthoniobacterales bacterium]